MEKGNGMERVTSPPIGFVALWHNKRSEYHAPPEEEAETGARIQQAFDNGLARGIRMYGRYGCRWSDREQYFTFWHCPNLEALEATMADLERAGDFKFAESEHLIGAPFDDPGMRDVQALETPEEWAACPYGFLAFWRLKDSYYRGPRAAWEQSDARIHDIFESARASGVRMLGRYHCRWSTEWDFFTFWQVPSLELLEEIMDSLEPAGDFMYADSRHVVGILEPHFRFARHLQGKEEQT